VVKGGGLPGSGRMTGVTVDAKLSVVVIVAGMADATYFGRPDENAVDMASGTAGVKVRAGELESGLVMVKGGRIPGCGGMAGATIIAKCASMMVIVAMTGGTILRRALKHIRDGVTLGTDCVDVSAI
jgi:hypothetical protein